MLFLVLNPEHDYEILMEGDINGNFKDHIIEAETADEAIEKHIVDNIVGGPIDEMGNLDSIEGFMALPVSAKKFVGLSKKRLDELHAARKKTEADEERQQDLKELERLKNKLANKK